MRSLAMLLEVRRDPAGAEAWNRRAAEAGDTDAMYSLALLLQRRADHDGAEQWFRRVADAGHAWANRQLGEVLVRRGALDEAERRYRAALDAGLDVVMVDLVRVRDERGDPAEAEGWYRRAAEDGLIVGADLGVLLLERGDVDGAEEWFGRAAGQEDLNGMQALGEVLRYRGDEAAAEAWWRSAAENGHSPALLSLVQQTDRRVGLPHDQRQELTAELVSAVDRPDDAINSYRLALRVLEALFGPAEKDAANVRTVLAMLAAQARHPVAEDVQRAVIADLERLTGPGSDEWLVARSNLAAVLVWRGAPRRRPRCSRRWSTTTGARSGPTTPAPS